MALGGLAGLFIGRAAGPCPVSFSAACSPSRRSRSTTAARPSPAAVAGGAARGPGAARHRLLGRARLPDRARHARSASRASGRAERLAQFLSAIEASPNGVLLLDARDQIEWCNARAADHFGLDPQRDRRQRITNLVRAPAFVGLSAGGAVRRAGHLPGPARQGAAVGAGPALWGGLEAGALAGHDRARALGGDAARLRRQRLARDPHAAHRPLGLPRDADQPAADARPSSSACWTMMTQQAQRMGTLVSDLLTLAQLEGSPRPPADRWVSVRGLLARVEADARALSAGRHAHCASNPRAECRSPARRPSCSARSPTSSTTRCATRPRADRSKWPGASSATARAKSR